MKIICDIINEIINQNNKIDNNNHETKLNKMDINLVNILLTSFILSKDYSIKKKYKFIKQTLNNIFIEKDIKYFFMDKIQEIQKKYFALNKFCFYYKLKKSKLIVTNDLYLNPINNEKNSICIFQDNGIYKFILSDLINIINNSLSNSSYFFSEPLPCKNPYNNIPFNKSTLYNIYFCIKNYNVSIPPLFYFYFLSNFNLTKFREDNEYFIREYVIKEYVKNKSVEILYSDIIVMLSNSNIHYYKKIKIHNDFPKKKLVDIMRPYLLLYFISKYSLNLEKQFNYSRILKNKLTRFFNFNPIFGRKKVDIIQIYSPEEKKMIKKKNIYFIDKHISFYDNNQDDFLESHCKINENETNDIIPNFRYQDIPDSESDDDTESDDTRYGNDENINDSDENSIRIPPLQENLSFIESNNILNNNSQNNLVSRVTTFTYHTDVDSPFFDEIYNELYFEIHNDRLNNILSSIPSEEEEKEDTDSIS